MTSPLQLIAQWINAAHLANARGEYVAAARLCKQVIKAAPRTAEAWYNLAIALGGVGKPTDAIEAAMKADLLARQSADAQNSIGLLLLELGANPAAQSCFERAIALAPRHPFAYCNLGRLQAQQKLYTEAESSLRHAIRLQPGLAPAHANLCGVLNARHDHEAAEATGRTAIELDPNSPVAWTNLGSALAALGRCEAAEAACRKAIEMAPDSSEAWTNLGVALSAMGQFAAAGDACRKAIELNPRAPEAWQSLGHTLSEIGQLEAAEQALRKAIEIDPGFAAGWSRLAEALVKRFRLSEAEVACRKVIELDPTSAAVHALLAEIHVLRWNFGQADAEYQRALESDPQSLNILSHRLFLLNYAPSVDPVETKAAALEYDRAAHRKVTPFDAWNCSPDRDRRLRVGLVSGDFYRHPVGCFLRGPLQELDKNSFELFAYSCGAREDNVTRALKSHCAAWRNVIGIDDVELAQRIHDDRIDILVDLSGHTENGRVTVFAWKPAPIQVTWLGYFATLGLREIDWRIGDPWVTPVGEEHHFTEKIWRLAETCYCFSPPSDAPAVADLPSTKNGHVTYGCFNNLAKLNDAVVEVWARVLAGDPEARLFLKAKQLASAELVSALVARFEGRGVGPDRLLLEGAGTYAEYLEAYARVDIALDPFPYTGGATTVEGLWMGVPVLTLKGDRYIGHQGESLLHAANLPDWIAADTDDYVHKALRYAADRSALAQLRAGLRAKVAGSALFDAPRFCRSLEAAWRGMWERWCDANDLAQASARASLRPIAD